MPKKKTKQRKNTKTQARRNHRTKPLSEERQGLLPHPRVHEPADRSQVIVPDGFDFAREVERWDGDRERVYPGGGVAVDLNFPSGSVPAVRVSFGELFPPERRRAINTGWGFSVELPAVLDILEAIAAGNISPQDAKHVLGETAQLLYGPLRCVETEDPQDALRSCQQTGDCVLCAERQTWFDSFLNHADEQWTRLQQPGDYPYAAGRNGLHDTTCHVVRRHNPDHYQRPTSDAYTAALRSYSHTVNPYSGTDEFADRDAYPRFQAMTAQEARQWTTERTGPKGGRNYKRCKHCAPAL